ncbi:MAG: hypothetical protein R2795_02895 [Saprospiraceae bacterium]
MINKLAGTAADFIPIAIVGVLLFIGFVLELDNMMGYLNTGQILVSQPLFSDTIGYIGREGMQHTEVIKNSRMKWMR